MVRSVGEKPVSPGRGLEHHFEVGADRAGPPAEQRARDAGEDVSRARSVTSAARHRPRAGCGFVAGWRCQAWRSLSGLARGRHRDRERRAAREFRSRAIPSSSASRIVLVVVAEQMQKAVHREMREMMLERLAFGAASRAVVSIGDDDVAEQRRRCARCAARALLRRKRQHVGRLVVAAPVAIERLDRRIIGQHDSKLRARR